MKNTQKKSNLHNIKKHKQTHMCQQTDLVAHILLHYNNVTCSRS